jgi:hypothetical protein
MSEKCLWNLAWGLDVSGPGLSHRGIELGQTCPSRGPDMSSQRHWNEATKPNKAERPDMSGLGSDMSGQSLWNPARRLDMSGLTGVLVV